MVNTFTFDLLSLSWSLALSTALFPQEKRKKLCLILSLLLSGVWIGTNVIPMGGVTVRLQDCHQKDCYNSDLPVVLWSRVEILHFFYNNKFFACPVSSFKRYSWEELNRLYIRHSLILFKCLDLTEQECRAEIIAGIMLYFVIHMPANSESAINISKKPL